MFTLSNVIFIFILTVLMSILLSWIKLKSITKNLFFSCMVVVFWTLSFIWAIALISYLVNMFAIQWVLKVLSIFIL
jgi:hypothetical protein